MLRIAVSGVNSPQKFQQLREAVPSREPYLQEPDKRLFLDFHYREQAHLALLNLKLLPGIQASLLEPSVESQDQPPSI